MIAWKFVHAYSLAGYPSCYSSLEEAGIYLSTYKLFEHKPPDIIKERIDKDYTSILQATLTSVKGINKTDVMTLRTTFGVWIPLCACCPSLLHLTFPVILRYCTCFREGVTSLPWPRANQSQTTKGRL